MEELNEIRTAIKNRYIIGIIVLILISIIITILTKNVMFVPFILVVE